MARLIQKYNNHARIDNQVQGEYNALLRHILEEEFITAMKRQSVEFGKLFRNIYYSGSYFDGLKVGTTDQEFDLNVVLNIDAKRLQIVGLEQDRKKPNFAFLQFIQDPKPEETLICDLRGGNWTLSPAKIFRLLQKAGDKALTQLGGRITYQGIVYRLTRSIGAPFTLILSGNGKNMKVDLVPAINMSLPQLPSNTQVMRRIQSLPITGVPQSFMAICLHRADENRFEIDFHDIERQILHDLGVVKPVIKILKVYRDKKGGPLAKLWSHFIKSSVMHTVLEEGWRTPQGDLVALLITCLRSLERALVSGSLTDVFFPQYNLMDRITKNYEQAVSDATRHFTRLLGKVDRTDGLEAKEELLIREIFGSAPTVMTPNIRLESQLACTHERYSEYEDDGPSFRPLARSRTEDQQNQGRGLGNAATVITLLGIGAAAAAFFFSSSRNNGRK